MEKRENDIMFSLSAQPMMHQYLFLITGRRVLWLLIAIISLLGTRLGDLFVKEINLIPSCAAVRSFVRVFSLAAFSSALCVFSVFKGSSTSSQQNHSWMCTAWTPLFPLFLCKLQFRLPF